ncbi:cytochrome c(L), periplasmic [Methylomonas sp. MED-D]|uniref:Cytochrome C n=1 Tax=Methylomonas koyamae TaxID=702114 RepID=A0A177NFR3_9GAMM|nr:MULTISPECIES: cytochrome c(L), periplasmic [Methylomonas]MDT4331575.1 cytochrome c(L), periplasmic [Methylomonas sp. MV1]NJA05234.1 cytochrome c(L), periplasmic [Methylococcaceae bacterium WWC4]OAI16701.1 cytochrome C [Methylomonas koyamae]WGS84283.1 cytochrome c(L), periplasmic [Methylomonas sp. UP202]
MKYKTFLSGAAAMLAIAAVSTARADITLRHALTGETLDLSFAKKGGNTDKFKQFMQTGKNPYNGDAEAIKKGESLYMTGCSGCHGHEAEGKLGPGLADDYWTYPRNATDVGLFEVLFGGANGMMGPQYVTFSTDEMLHIMAFIRHIYKGDPKKADWLK